MSEQGNELEFNEEYMNLRPARLYEIGTSLEGAQISSTGALAANSGAKTGRSTKDKRVVKNSATEGDVWWGSVNIALEESSFETNRAAAIEFLAAQPRLYVVD